MLTCNSDGSEKLKPILIHKYQNPRALKNVDKSTLPVIYHWNNKSWMLSSIFDEYLTNLNNMMRIQNRNILLMIDNAPTHKVPEAGLSNIEVFFLPPNTTSILQPCDAGIINSFKVIFMVYTVRSLTSK